MHKRAVASLKCRVLQALSNDGRSCWLLCRRHTSLRGPVGRLLELPVYKFVSWQAFNARACSFSVRAALGAKGGDSDVPLREPPPRINANDDDDDDVVW